jgi:hypothetical protein
LNVLPTFPNRCRTNPFDRKWASTSANRGWILVELDILDRGVDDQRIVEQLQSREVREGLCAVEDRSVLWVVHGPPAIDV